MKIYNAKEIIEDKTNPLIDVRSPGEYENAHIPGAINIPLFSDEERAKVGTIYKKRGKAEAISIGLEFVGKKLSGFVKQARKIAKQENKINLYCWRGGMRSNSMAWLFETAGMNTAILKGGYKAYKHFIKEDLNADAKLIVLGGMTGSGKTQILKELARMGEQVIDLEGLAKHKGSAFGGIGQEKQPSTEMFENLLHQDWAKLDKSKAIWLEDESLSIGSVWINNDFFDKMRAARFVFINVDFEYRADNLLQEYGILDKESLINSINKISKRLGGLETTNAINYVSDGNIKPAIEIALRYYDKTYKHGLSKRGLIHHKIDFTDTSSCLKELKDISKSL